MEGKGIDSFQIDDWVVRVPFPKRNYAESIPCPGWGDGGDCA